jgi:ferredoxin
MDQDQKSHSSLSRRDFITGMAITIAAAGAGAAALSPLINAEEIPSIDDFLQKHYTRLTTDEKKAIFARLENEISSTYGVKATIGDSQPLEGVEYGYALNISRCIGCRKCVYACMKENNLSRNPQVQYIRVLKMKKEGQGIDLESSVHDYPQEEAGDPNYYYMPVQCQQCANLPCVKVCPVKATWQEKDGKQKSGIDWVASGNAKKKNGQTAESVLGSGGIKSAGKPYKTRSYLRWEDPVLGIGGEGRVSPLMPGCQITYTVINEAGKTIAHNVMADSPDEAVVRKQEHVPLAIDMAPVQPHTAQRKARTCESCHANLKTAGLGMGGGTFGSKQHMDIVEDLIDAKTGEIIPKKYSIQIPGISRLKFDWSKIVERDGTQLATVGTHWPMSQALNKEELDSLLRAGACMGCHQNMADKKLWEKVSEKGKLDPKQHIEMMNKMIKFMAEKAQKGTD